ERLGYAAFGRRQLALWRRAKDYDRNTAHAVHHLQLSQELGSGQLGQGHVHQDDVALILLEEPESRGPVRSSYNRVAKVAQYVCREPALPGVVVHHESGASLVARIHSTFLRAKVGESTLCSVAPRTS